MISFSFVFIFFLVLSYFMFISFISFSFHFVLFVKYSTYIECEKYNKGNGKHITQENHMLINLCGFGHISRQHAKYKWIPPGDRPRRDPFVLSVWLRYLQKSPKFLKIWCPWFGTIINVFYVNQYHFGAQPENL